MRNINTAVVFCGSRFGNDERFRQSAEEAGASLAQMGIHLKYGGGSSGLMGTVAKTAIEHGGTVTGIAPEVFREAALTAPEGVELLFSDDMMERKKQLIEGSDIIIALGGGIGTLEEIFETIMVNYLDLNNNPDAQIKPIIFFDPTGMSNKIIEYVQDTVDAGMSDPSVMKTLFSVQNVEELDALILQWQDDFPKVKLAAIPEMKTSVGAQPSTLSRN